MLCGVQGVARARAGYCGFVFHTSQVATTPQIRHPSGQAGSLPYQTKDSPYYMTNSAETFRFASTNSRRAFSDGLPSEFAGASETGCDHHAESQTARRFQKFELESDMVGGCCGGL
jgi:hypothetical protein